MVFNNGFRLFNANDLVFKIDLKCKKRSCDKISSLRKSKL